WRQLEDAETVTEPERRDSAVEPESGTQRASRGEPELGEKRRVHGWATDSRLPKVVAGHPLEFRNGPEPLRADGERAVLALQTALHDQGARADDHGALVPEEVGPHDRLEHPGLVLQRQEHEALRGPG